MKRHTGAYYTATVEDEAMFIESKRGSLVIVATRDEALDLLDCINAVIGAMPVDMPKGRNE